MHRLFYFLLLMILCAACQDSSESAYYEEFESNKAAYPSPDMATAEDRASSAMEYDLDEESPQRTTLSERSGQTDLNLAAPNRKIIYTANARMQVDSLENSIQEIIAKTTAIGGFLSSQRIDDDTYQKTATLVLRIPVNGFSNQVNELLELGTFIDYQAMNSQDVSAEWIDLESRLATKREVRDRYIDILRKRAKKVEDILAAEDKIRVITEEIEAREGRLRYLSDQVKMSTFTLEVYQTQEVRTPPPAYVRHFGHEILDSLSNGLSFIKHLLLGVLSVWPLFLLIPFGIWGWRKWRG